MSWRIALATLLILGAGCARVDELGGPSAPARRGTVACNTISTLYLQRENPQGAFAGWTTSSPYTMQAGQLVVRASYTYVEDGLGCPGWKHMEWREVGGSWTEFDAEKQAFGSPVTTPPVNWVWYYFAWVQNVPGDYEIRDRMVYEFGANFYSNTIAITVIPATVDAPPEHDLGLSSVSGTLGLPSVAGVIEMPTTGGTIGLPLASGDLILPSVTGVIGKVRDG